MGQPLGLWRRTAEGQKAELLRSGDGESFIIGAGLCVLGPGTPT